MADAIVIQDVESQPTGLRQAIYSAQETQALPATSGYQKSMATIDDALAQARAPKDKKPPPPPAPLLAPPDPYAPQKLSPEEKKREAELKRIRQHQEALLGKEQAKAQEEERQKQLARQQSLLGLADKVGEGAQKAVSAGQVKLSGLPQPGDIWFPLVLLLLFFFILILYNGHTRLVWLWLVLTGNADLSSTPGGSASGDFGGPAPNFGTDAFHSSSNGNVPVGGQASGDFGPGTVSPNGTYGSF